MIATATIKISFAVLAGPGGFLWSPRPWAPAGTIDEERFASHITNFLELNRGA